MAKVSNHNGELRVTAYVGDAKTLLAFNIAEKASKSLAGFTIECQPGEGPPYYLLNNLVFEDPSAHAQDPAERPDSSVNAPFHKFRWLHVPGLFHQGLKPFFGPYTYTITPRYFDADDHMLPLDPKLSVPVTVGVGPFAKGSLQLGFTRGFTQSQAFVDHFGEHAPLCPPGKDLIYQSDQVAGKNDHGKTFTFEDEYQWSGFTARQKVLDILEMVKGDDALSLDVFAYDLREPAVIDGLLKIARQGHLRLILDNADLHHNQEGTRPEDEVEAMFRDIPSGDTAIKRGKFGRYAHDKVFIVRDAQGARSVLTGSTNFSLTGLYVNSNHVLVFDDRDIAKAYAAAFDLAWSTDVSRAPFMRSDVAVTGFASAPSFVPATTVSFSPHTKEKANDVLAAIVTRIKAEGALRSKQSVLFAVMDLGGSGPVFPALKELHENQAVFSFGICDGPEGIDLYKPGIKGGLLVSGTPASTVLPPPFAQVPGVGFGHQVHHKFVVCGFNRPDATVFCGSSNLALGGEEENGDNLLTIQDEDVATAFALEAMALVDHFNFLDKAASGGKGDAAATLGAPPKPVADAKGAAVKSKWFLSVGDGWVKAYFDPNDLKYADRVLFGQMAD